ncbi:alkanesulfonate monooxygenase SsuD/methylene tetrahydromethanopterin reductase-like flavin-dependent oxidoreductase (luciferase family) [Rhodococcus sp. 27YEA15]|uniref:LLM class flavin-dependent oxidoreductase n=1 Tax=Rhodococcus sp. 27YEA15 TaxID=3156259 RepID=UPI003C7D51FF
MPFTFAYITFPAGGQAWTDEAQRAEGLGYSTILLPDTYVTPSPFPYLAAAAVVTKSVKLRSWVLAAPTRTAATTVREVDALQNLSDGRFELGISSGRPDAAAEAAAAGLPWGSAPERRAQVAETVQIVRESVDPAPPVIVTAGGPKALIAAAGYADRIGLAAQPQATEAQLHSMVDVIRSSTNPNIPLTFQIGGIGDHVDGWVRRMTGMTDTELREVGAVGLLDADPAVAAELLEGLYTRWGVDEIIVPSSLTDVFAPVMKRLT